MQLYGIIGDNLEKSLSPKIFRSVFKTLKLDARYLPFEVEKPYLKNLVLCMKLIDLQGLNVTQPYKKEVVRFLDRLEPFAAKTGAVNCIVRKKNRFIGYNTDGPGFLNALREKTELCLKGKQVTILGAGGASFGIAAICKKAGAKVTLMNRSGRYPRLNPTAFRKQLPKTDLLVNTLPVDIAVPLGLLPKSALVADIRYNPHRTKLLQAAQKKNFKTIDGLWMFVHQAALNLNLWTGKQVSPDTLRKQLR